MTAREKIQFMFGWSDLKYALKVERMGYKWALRHYGPDLTKALVTSKMFWKWWVNQWNIREEDHLRETLLGHLEDPLSGNLLTKNIKEWYNTHDPYKMSVHPGKLVYNDLQRMLKDEEKNYKSIKKQTHKIEQV